MRKTKIAQVITRLDWGGPPDILRLICESLDPDKLDVTIITGLTLYPSERTKKFLNEFPGRIINIPQLQRDVSPLNDLTALFRLYRLMRRGRFDIVHTHTAKAGALGRIAAWLEGKAKVIHTSHGHNFYGYFGPLKSRLVILAERFLTFFTDRVTALTELEKSDLEQYKVTGPDKVMIIYSGLEMDQFGNGHIDEQQKRSELGAVSDSVLIGMVGRLEHIKGPEHFIESIPAVSERFPDTEFLLVGEGSLRDRLESRCKELNISDRVIFTGWREDVPDILKVLDIVVLPSLNEAVGRTLIEAGACGKPVVATKVGGVPEMVRDGETGLLVPAADSASLVDALISLLKDKEKRLTMGETASRWVDDKFSATRMVEGFAHLYDEFSNRL
jgi:glycosyltransferase involved in cell wall biosynthesis